MQKPVMLLILDGWGYRANVTPTMPLNRGIRQLAQPAGDLSALFCGNVRI